MGLPPVVHLGCYTSVEATSAGRKFAGWFSSVRVDHDHGLYCIHGYNSAELAFAVLLSIMAVLSTITCLCVLFIFLRRRMKRCARGHPSVDARRVCDREVPSITAVIPCYLPNEQEIIEETVDWITHKVEWPGQLDVFVVYNTPVDLPDVESRLVEMQESADWSEGRSFRAYRVRESRSKAANLNAALKMVDTPYVVIYDADHHPDSDSLLLLWEKMSRRQVGCVQGGYYMRNLSQN